MINKVTTGSPWPSQGTGSAKKRIGAPGGGSIDSSSGSDAEEAQKKAEPAELKKNLEQLKRESAAGQIINESNRQQKKLDQEHMHQGAMGRTTENLHNSLNQEHSYNNVKKRTEETQRHAGNLAYQTPSGGDSFNSSYNKMTGLNYDPKKPVREDTDKKPFKGELGKNEKSIEKYIETQKIGNIIQTMFFPGGGPAAMAVEDNTRGDGTHDYKAGDYFKSAGIMAATLVPIPGVGAAIGTAGKVAGKIAAKAGINTGKAVATVAKAGGDTGKAAASASKFGENTIKAVETSIKDGGKTVKTAASAAKTLGRPDKAAASAAKAGKFLGSSLLPPVPGLPQALGAIGKAASKFTGNLAENTGNALATTAKAGGNTSKAITTSAKAGENFSKALATTLKAGENTGKVVTPQEITKQIATSTTDSGIKTSAIQPSNVRKQLAQARNTL